MQQLESNITMIQPDSTLWSERNMKSSNIFHTDNIQSHPIAEDFPSDSNNVQIQTTRSKFEKPDFFLSFSKESNGLEDQEKECSKV